MGRRLSGNGGGGGKPKVEAYDVLTTGGVVKTLTRRMDSGSTFALLTADSGVTFNTAAGAISATIGAGEKKSLVVTERAASGAGYFRPITLTGLAPVVTLGALTLSASTAAVGSVTTINILGATVGSLITGAVPDGMTLNSAARTITGAPTTAGIYTFALSETLVGGTNTPNASTVTIAVAATLSTLTLAASTVVENTSAGTVIGGILGATAGSSLSLVDSAGGRFAISDTNIVTGSVATDFETATSHNITIRETLAGAANSPRDTTVSISVTNVFEQPNLSALSLSTTSFTTGSPASGSITGSTAGSTISASGLPSGLTINGAARTWAWSGVGSAATSTITLTETLADSANSPRNSTVSVTVVSGATMTPYLVINNFDSLTGITGQSGTALSLTSPVVLGTGSALFQTQGVNTPAITLSATAINNSEDPATWAGSLIAFCVDLGTVPYVNNVANVVPTITTGGVAYSPRYDQTNNGNVSAVNHANFNRLGKVWYASNPSTMRQTSWAGAPLTSAAAASKTMTIQVQQTLSGAIGHRNNSVKVDALVRVTQPRKAQIMITVDDCNIGQFAVGGLEANGMASLAKTICDNRGAKIDLTGYCAYGRLISGNATWMNVAQAKRLQDTYGWTWCLDSDPMDLSFAAYESPDAVRTMLDGMGQNMLASGLGTQDSIKHVCASWGFVNAAGVGYKGNVLAVSNSTDITLQTGDAAYTNGAISAGMRVKGTGLSTMPTVVKCPTSSTVKLDTPITLAATTALTFCGNQSGVAVQCDGSAIIYCDTTYLIKDQVMYGYNVPADTKIVSIDIEGTGTSGKITVSNPVPSTCTIASFMMPSLPFATGKLANRLLLPDAGGFAYRTNRGWTTSYGGHFTQFGVDPYTAMDFGCMGLDGTSAAPTRAKNIAWIEDAIVNGRDVMWYIHAGGSQDWSDFQTWFDYLAVQVAAGRCTAPSVPAGWAEWQKRLPIS